MIYVQSEMIKVSIYKANDAGMTSKIRAYDQYRIA